MDFKVDEILEAQAQELGFNQKVAELSELQLVLAGGGCGDVIFA